MIRRLLEAAEGLSDTCEKLSFAAPVTHVYNPLVYARKSHHAYLRRYANTPKRALFLGMNPGPWGMAQTGVPFGEVAAVRDWLGIKCLVDRPKNEHPLRSVLGFDCPRSEVSGRRLWGFFAKRFGTAGEFFADNIVLNYCPLLFLHTDSKRCVNLTPDKLSATDKEPLYAACNSYLRVAVECFRPDFLIGVGGFAERRLHQLFGDDKSLIGKILHPSPASPAANRGFEKTAAKQLQALGVFEN
ncbi:MAG: hypothetical protein R1F54_07055 [Candidatus Zeuxoniibacter abyssi]|nr:MAG: hypothetical protein R1F54_07055 [Candidatus Persebacteraceae bacterium AB1(2)]